MEWHFLQLTILGCILPVKNQSFAFAVLYKSIQNTRFPKIRRPDLTVWYSPPFRSRLQPMQINPA